MGKGSGVKEERREGESDYEATKGFVNHVRSLECTLKIMRKHISLSRGSDMIIHVLEDNSRSLCQYRKRFERRQNRRKDDQLGVCSNNPGIRC